VAEIPGEVEAVPSPLAFLEPTFGWLQRAETWRFAAEQIQKQTALGYGFGGSGGFSQTYVLYTPSYSFTLPYIPGHPLSAPIQIWLETGAVGAVLAAAALASFGRRAGAAVADDRIAAAAAAGLLAATAFIMTVSGWTWSLWWWASVAVGVALIRAAKRPT
jgi:O-antigen ligase